MVTQHLYVRDVDMWYIDSGCTSHMVRDQRLFSSLNSSCRTKVKLGNGMIVEAQGKSSVPIYTKQGTKFITNVLLIPGLQ